MAVRRLQAGNAMWSEHPLGMLASIYVYIKIYNYIYVCIRTFLFTVKITSSEVVLLSQKSTSSKVGSGRLSEGMYRDSTVRSS